jgi:quercetin dioxygenase-like cupin family protein
LIDRQLIVGDNIMIARVLLKREASVPMHSRLNEQVTYILEGALRFRIQDKEIVVATGEVPTMPSGMPHEAVALEDTVPGCLYATTCGLDDGGPTPTCVVKHT